MHSDSKRQGQIQASSCVDVPTASSKVLIREKAMAEYVKVVDLLDACTEVEYLGRPRMMVSASKIAQLPSIEIPQWIPCEERMPKGIGAYIISGKMKYDFESEYEYFVDVAEYDPIDSEFHSWNDWYEGQDEFEIVAWMPLPKPYGKAVEK